MISNPTQFIRGCPKCGNSQTVSIRSVAATGTYKTIGTSATVGGAHITGGGPNIVGGAVGVNAQKTTSELAKLLAFPFSEPKKEPFYDKTASCAGCLMFFVSAVGLAMLFKQLTDSDSLAWVAILLGLILGAIVTMMFQATNKAKNEVEEAAHKQNQEGIQADFRNKKVLYERLMYCEKCFSVYDPASGRVVPCDQLQALF